MDAVASVDGEHLAGKVNGGFTREGVQNFLAGMGMVEYPIARLYLDTRVQTIHGGTTEIMKEIIGRALLG